MQAILPSVPRFPKPPGINIPEAFFNLFLILFDFNLSDSSLIKLILTLFWIPPCVKASSKDL